MSQIEKRIELETLRKDIALQKQRLDDVDKQISSLDKRRTALRSDLAIMHRDEQRLVDEWYKQSLVKE